MASVLDKNGNVIGSYTDTGKAPVYDATPSVKSPTSSSSGGSSVTKSTSSTPAERDYSAEWWAAYNRGDNAGMAAASQAAKDADKALGYIRSDDGTQRTAIDSSATATSPEAIRSKSIYAPYNGDISAYLTNIIGSGDYDKINEAVNDRGFLLGGSPDGQQSYYIEERNRLKKEKEARDRLAAEQEESKKLLEEQNAAQRAAIDAGVESAVFSLENQKGTVNSSAEDNARQAWIEYMKAKNQYGVRANQMARNGSGGSGDFMQVSALNGYQGANATILSQRDKLINDIEVAIVQAKQNGNIALANQLAESLGKQLENIRWGYTAGADIERDAWNNYLAVKQQAENNAAKEKEWNYQEKRDAVNDAYNNLQLNNSIAAEDRAAYERWVQYYIVMYPGQPQKAAQLAADAVARQNQLYPVG